jgi:glutamine amidotransferase
MSNQIVIVDYGMGNLQSVKKKLMKLNVDAIISSNPKDIQNANKIILPGVGHFGQAMLKLHQLDLIQVLNEQVLHKNKPILGICLGMQLMALKSEEGNVNGLGWIDADVVKFKVNDKLKYKIPHTGWNDIIIKKESPLMIGISNLSEFYFVHSYYFKPHQTADILNETEYEERFVSSIQRENIFGVQYHPEKSHDVGEVLLKNFINL